MMLEAWDQGLGTCWVNLFPNSRLAAELSLAENHKPVLLMPIGFPADNATPNPLHHQTRPLAELVTPNSRLAAELSLAENHKPVLLMPIGFPADNATPNPLHHQTRPLAELVTIL